MDKNSKRSAVSDQDLELVSGGAWEVPEDFPVYSVPYMVSNSAFKSCTAELLE